MIDAARIQSLNAHPIDPSKKYVLYWMQASQRTRFNFALEHAIEQANFLGLPLVVCFGLMDDFPGANERHYAFLIQGLRDVERSLQSRGVKFVVKHGQAPDVAVHFAIDAAMVVCDRGYTRYQRAWRDAVADGARVSVVQVESDVVVPVETVSDHHEFAARTIRPKIHRTLQPFLKPLAANKVKHPSSSMNITGDIDLGDPDALLKKLKLDRSTGPVRRFVGGEDEAARRLKAFVGEALNGYDEARNEPASAATSHMSPYLHFGHISPVEIVLAVNAEKGIPEEDRESYVEELVVRRELSMNFCQFNAKYDSYEGLPQWARKTLSEHRNDERPITYTREQLENAQTADPYWNAAMTEMTRTGFMHNYMRMYWGKKILEWTPDPQVAYEMTLAINNKYFLCGRDPNSFANVAWLYGTHDRPWGPARKIFGTVRYMNAKGLERKFDMDAYIEWVKKLSP